MEKKNPSALENEIRLKSTIHQTFLLNSIENYQKPNENCTNGKLLQQMCTHTSGHHRDANIKPSPSKIIIILSTRIWFTAFIHRCGNHHFPFDYFSLKFTNTRIVQSARINRCFTDFFRSQSKDMGMENLFVFFVFEYESLFTKWVKLMC